MQRIGSGLGEDLDRAVAGVGIVERGVGSWSMRMERMVLLGGSVPPVKPSMVRVACGLPAISLQLLQHEGGVVGE